MDLKLPGLQLRFQIWHFVLSKIFHYGLHTVYLTFLIREGWWITINKIMKRTRVNAMK